MRLAPAFTVAAVVGALLDILILAAVAEAAVALTAGSDKTVVSGALSILSGFTPGELVLLGLGLCVLRVGPYLIAAEVPARLAARVQEDLRLRLAHAYLHSPWLEQLAVRDGELQEVASQQTNQAAQAVLVGMQALSYGVTLFVLVVGAVVLAPIAAVAALGALAALFFMLRPLARRVSRLADEYAGTSVAYMTMISEAADLVSDMRTYGVVDPEEQRLTAAVEELRRPWHHVQRLHGLVPGVYQTAVIALLLSGLGVVVVSGLNQSVADLGTVVLVLLRALAASQQLQYSYQRLKETEPFVDRALDLIDRLEGGHTAAGTRHLERVETLVLENVSFSYRPSRPAVNGVSFAVQRGECIGVTGPSGAGKSTLAAIMLGLLTPDAGRYLVNGIPVSDVVAADWCRRLGYVAQDGHLVTGTVADNIRFLREGISDEDVERAAIAAHLHDDVMHWADGYATNVSQKTDAVSGGQRQRICLARALVCHPDFLVLDEPTSALDAEAERVVFDSLAELKGTVTMIIVSHRPRLLELCDRVVTFRHGHTLGDGSGPSSAVAAG